jgi:MATE family multidrug resistance protein
LRDHAITMLRLAGPLLGNNLALAGMTFADTVMAGQLGPRDLAAVAIGATYYSLHLFVALGLLMGLSPLVAHAYGSGNNAAVRRYFRQSVWLCLACAVILVTGMWQADRVFELLNITAEIRPLARDYVYAMSCGLPGMIGFLALRFTSEGIGWTRPVMYVGFTGLITNIFGNWLFIYGNLGAPRLGAVGCGVASAIVMWMMFAVMLVYVRRHRIYEPYSLFSRSEPFAWAVQRELLLIGLPIAGSLLAEGGSFAAAGFMMGTLGAVTAAAHQIALSYASSTFMIPLAVHSATTIHIGHLLGRGDRSSARRAGWVAIGMCGGMMLCSAIIILLGSSQIAALYTQDPQVLRLAVTLLMVAGVFQVSDGLQVGAAGALRGFKDTRIPMLLNLASYWLIGFPLAYVFGLYLGYGPVYVWFGLTVGLSTAALLLNTRFWLISRRPSDSKLSNQVLGGVREF